MAAEGSAASSGETAVTPSVPFVVANGDVATRLQFEFKKWSWGNMPNQDLMQLEIEFIPRVLQLMGTPIIPKSQKSFPESKKPDGCK